MMAWGGRPRRAMGRLEPTPTLRASPTRRTGRSRISRWGTGWRRTGLQLALAADFDHGGEQPDADVRLRDDRQQRQPAEPDGERSPYSGRHGDADAVLSI